MHKTEFHCSSHRANAEVQLLTQVWLLQGPTLVSLPSDVLTNVISNLGTPELNSLKLVCKQLSALVCLSTTHVTTSQRLSQQYVSKLEGQFPALRRISCEQPVSTYHLSRLTRLTHISFSSHSPSLRRFFTVDYGPLEALPQLRSLQLKNMSIQQLSSASSCALAALT